MASLVIFGKGLAFITVLALLSVNVEASPQYLRRLQRSPNQHINNQEMIAEFVRQCREGFGVQIDFGLQNPIDEHKICIQQVVKSPVQLDGKLDVLEDLKQMKIFCGHQVEITACWDNFIRKWGVCMADTGLQYLNILRQVNNAGLKFMCDEDSDRYTTFISENGLECLESQMKNIQKCIEEKVPDKNYMSNEHHQISFSEEFCSGMYFEHQCVVEWTEKCEKKTPSKILNTFIGRILKETPCRSWKAPKSPSASPSIFAYHCLPLMLTMLAAVLTVYKIL